MFERVAALSRSVDQISFTVDRGKKINTLNILYSGIVLFSIMLIDEHGAGILRRKPDDCDGARIDDLLPLAIYDGVISDYLEGKYVG